MPFPYKNVLVIGATSGIGLALSERFISNGIHVIAVGRRQQNLDSFVQKHGKDKVSSFQFDITNLSGIPEFVQQCVLPLPSLPFLPTLINTL
jgi:NADP-dependent 3-hydroxy acid dehydrogenase YdfG